MIELSSIGIVASWIGGMIYSPLMEEDVWSGSVWGEPSLGSGGPQNLRVESSC